MPSSTMNSPHAVLERLGCDANQVHVAGAKVFSLHEAVALRVMVAARGGGGPAGLPSSRYPIESIVL